VSYQFNLVDQGWIPCILPKPGGTARELGIRETLARAHEIAEIFDASPFVTVAIHRLLLAILHRNFGPENQTAWKALWDRGAFDSAKLGDYLNRWRDRFHLFHPKRPFCQVTELNVKPVPVAKLAHELAVGNNDTLFDHSFDSSGARFSAAQGARYLLAFQTFAAPGTISRAKGDPPSAPAAPLAKGAVVLVKGGNLFQTLMLNLHRYNPKQEEPFECSPSDAPAWEHEEQAGAEDRLPEGYLDLLTWQSRCARLIPEANERGESVVAQFSYSRGAGIPDSWSPFRKETMFVFKRNPKAEEHEESWLILGLKEERAVWRDSSALFEIKGKYAPRTVEWLSGLVESGTLDRSRLLSVDVLGFCPEKQRPAKLLFWRHERLPLPLAYLREPQLIDRLRIALKQAEDVEFDLRAALFELARLLLAAEADRPAAPQPDKKNVQGLLKSISVVPVYWSRLEVPFSKFLVDLAADRTKREDGSPEYGNTALPEWAATVRRTATSALGELTRSLDSSARSLKAGAVAKRTFDRHLARTLPNPDKQEEVNHATAQ